MKRFTFLFLLLFIIGCGQTQNTSLSSSSSTDWTTYFPIITGMYKKLTKLNNNNYFTEQSNNETFNYNNLNLQIIKRKDVNIYYGGSFIYSWESESLYKIDSTGVYYYGTKDYPTTEASIILSFPIEINKSWLKNNYVTGVDIYITTAEVIKSEIIATSIGTFDAFKIKYADYIKSGTYESTYITYDWYAKNIGLVRQQTIIGTSESIYELTQKNI